MSEAVREMSYAEALTEALREEMLRDERVIILGEDVELAYVFTVTRGLVEEFGMDRVRDTPISEGTIVGAALGAALMGMRPVAEIMFADFITLSMDQIVNQAAKARYMFGGQFNAPMVIRTPTGRFSGFGATHSQCLEAWFMHVPGLKVAIPSTPYDAKGLLKAAIRDDNPVLFFEHKRLYRQKGPVPEGDYTLPLGEADVKRDGKDVTIIAISQMVHLALSAAEKLESEGISALVLDPRTLAPLDREGILSAVQKTGRVVIAEEGCRTGGVGAEIAATIAEEALDYLDAPLKRVAALDSPIPFSIPLEEFIFPDEAKLIAAVREMFG